MKWLVMSCVLCATATRAEDALAWLMHNTGFAEVPLERLASGHLAASVTINGQIGLYVIDSGASQTVLDRRRAALYPLGPPVARSEIAGVTGPQAVQVHRIAIYTLGQTAGFDGVVHVADLSAITEAIANLGGPVVDGVVGQDWLTAHGAVLDLGSDRLFVK